MRNSLDPFSKFLAVACAALFALTAGLALLLVNAERRLFDADFYLAALDRQNFYDRLPALAAETVMGAPASDDPNSARNYLNLVPAQNWEALFRALLPPEVSRPMTEQAVASVFDYLNGKSEAVVVSLTAFKNHLAGPAGTEALFGIVRAQPACSFEQIAQLTVGSLFGQTPSFMLCNPSDSLLDLFQPLIQSQVQAIAASIPDSVDLTPSKVGAESPLKSLRSLRTLMRLSLLLPLGLLLLVGILAVRRWRDILTWWGIPLFAAGLFRILLSRAPFPPPRLGAPRTPPASIADCSAGRASPSRWPSGGPSASPAPKIITQTSRAAPNRSCANWRVSCRPNIKACIAADSQCPVFSDQFAVSG